MTVARYSADELRRFTAGVLAHAGLPPRDAEVGATVLNDADLAGVDTHGITNLATHPHYLPGLRNGQVDPRAEVTVLRDAAVAAAWESGCGFGPVIAQRAMRAAIDKAAASGVGMVTVRNGRHFGANGYFAEMAARQGLIGMAVANTPAVGVPPGASTALVGTNPLAFAAPRGDGAPLVIDIALTAVSGSRVMAAAATGATVPPGWVVDAAGHPSEDPTVVRAGGGMELLGGQVAGHKGYGLALMVDILGILAGNGSGVWQRPFAASWSQGQWFAAWRIDLFIDPAEFEAEVQRLADHVHSAPTRDGSGGLLPGDRRAASRAERSAAGVPLPADLGARLRAVGVEAGVPFPEPLR